MSGQILVKYEAMQSYVGQMNQLMEDIESSKEEPPEQAGGGQVAERIEQLNESWRMLSSSMKMLTQASKMFMENAAKLFQESDQLILNPETRKVTSEKEYDREVIQEWRDKTGKTAGNIGSQSYKRGNPFYNSGYEGQCTWYCYGRFLEKTGISLSCLRNAKYWISGNRNCDGVDILNSLENVDGPAVAVADMGNQYGHVIFIEKVVRNEDGKIRELYISESNGWVSDNEFSNNHRYDEGKDGIVQKVSPETFYRRYRGLLGYIVPKRQ